MSLPAVSKHLGVLEDAGLLLREKAGRIRRCHLQPEAMREAADWITDTRRFWEQQLDQLDRYLQSTVQAHDKESPDGTHTAED